MYLSLTVCFLAGVLLTRTNTQAKVKSPRCVRGRKKYGKACVS